MGRLTGKVVVRRHFMSSAGGCWRSSQPKRRFTPLNRSIFGAAAPAHPPRLRNARDVARHVGFAPPWVGRALQDGGDRRPSPMRGRLQRVLPAAADAGKPSLLRRVVKRMVRVARLSIQSLRSEEMDGSYTFKRWRGHQSPMRAVQLWYPTAIVHSETVRRLLFPDLAMVGSIAWFVCYYNTCVVSGAELTQTSRHGFDVYFHPNMLSLPIEPFGLTVMAIGLLVTFRTQECHARYAEARKLWATCANESKSLASRVLERIPSEHSNPIVPRARTHTVRLLQTFPHTLKFRITVDGCSPDIEQDMEGKSYEELLEEKRAALREELLMIWDMTEPWERSYVNRLLAAAPHSWPLHVLNELSYLNANVFNRPDLGMLEAPVSADVDKSITVLHNVLGGCERIFVTPIYTEYTKCTSLILYAWCTGLPFALYPLAGHAGTMPISLVVAFFMFSIEDIGSRIEQPFDNLPLWEYCDDIHRSCKQMELHSEALKHEESDAWAQRHHSKWEDMGFASMDRYWTSMPRF